MKYFIIVTAILLLITGIFNLHFDYGYYQILRWIVCVCSIILTFKFYNKNNKIFILYSVIAILFNPIAPIYLNKDVWKFLDIFTGIAFIYIFKLKL